MMDTDAIATAIIPRGEQSKASQLRQAKVKIGKEEMGKEQPEPMSMFSAQAQALRWDEMASGQVSRTK